MAGNYSTITKEVWDKVKIDYFAGDYKSLRELSDKYQIKQMTLRNKIVNNQWNIEKENQQRTLLNKVEKLKESEAEIWVQRVKERSRKDWQIIDESIDGLVQSTGGIEASDLRNYVAARKLLDDMSRRALGLVEPAQSLDLTSKGQSIGESIFSAIAKIREDQSIPKITSEDVDRILEADVIEDSKPKYLYTQTPISSTVCT